MYSQNSFLSVQLNILSLFLQNPKLWNSFRTLSQKTPAALPKPHSTCPVDQFGKKLEKNIIFRFFRVRVEKNLDFDRRFFIIVVKALFRLRFKMRQLLKDKNGFSFLTLQNPLQRWLSTLQLKIQLKKIETTETPLYWSEIRQYRYLCIVFVWIY